MNTCPVILINYNYSTPLISPVGLEYIASNLLSSGIKPAILDLNFVRDIPSVLVEQINKCRPKIIGISIRNLCNQYMQNSESFLDLPKALIRLARGITDATIILGGVGYSSAPLEVLKYLDADLGLAGSGLGLFPAIVKSILNGNSTFKHRSIINNKSHDFTPHIPDQEDYRNFLPKRNLVDNKKYFAKGGCIGVETKIGCPKACIYCVEPCAKGKRQVLRDPIVVIKEIEQLIVMGITAIHFCDSEFNLPVGHAEDIAILLTKKGLNRKLKWFAYCDPASRNINIDTLQIFKGAGCQGLNFGIDSLDDLLLSTYKREHTYADIVNIAAACRQLELPFKLDLLVGGPGETDESLKRSIMRLIKLNPTKASVNLGIRVYPNTPLAKIVRKEHKGAVISSVDNNRAFLFPAWYVSDKLKSNPVELIRQIAGNQKNIIIPSDIFSNAYLKKISYPLKQLAKGKKGVFWNLS